MNRGNTIFKKTMFLFGRALTLLAILTTAVYLLWYSCYPVYHLLSRTPGLSVLFFDDAIILPLSVSFAAVTAVGILNLLCYKKEVPVYDHFLSLIQMPLLVFGSQIVTDCVDKAYGDRFSLWDNLLRFGSGQATAQIVMILYFLILAVFSAALIHSTFRYAAGKTRRKKKTEEQTTGAGDLAA